MKKPVFGTRGWSLFFVAAVMLWFGGRASAQTVFDFDASAGTISNIFPFAGAATGSKIQVWYTPAQLQRTAQSTILEYGVQHSVATAKTWTNVKIWMGETTVTAQGSISTTFDANYDVPAYPKTLVYDGPVTCNVAINGYWRVPLTAPYVWSATKNLLVTFYVSPAGTGTGGSVRHSAAFPNPRLYNNSGPDPATATGLSQSYGLGASFKWQDIVAGDSAQVNDFGVVTTGTALGLPSVASNVLRVSIKNGGSTSLNGSLPLIYSTDNGVTFPPANAQTFTMTNFASNTYQTFDMTTAAPWVVTALGSYNVVVKIDSTTLGTSNLTKTINFKPDADITAASTGTQDPQLGNNTVYVTVKNNGNFNLNGASIPLRYTVDGGTTYSATQNVTASTLAANGDTQVFTLTALWNLATAGNINLTPSIFPVLTGDPDVTDSFTRNYPEAGTPGTLLSITAGTTANTIPFATLTFGKVQAYWAASQLGSPTGLITHIGLHYTTTNTFTYSNFRIKLGECNPATLATPGTLGTTFANNFNVAGAGPTTCYDAPLTFSANLSTPWRIALATPFFYSGQNGLLMECYYSTATVAASVYEAPLAPGQRVYATAAADPLTGTVDAAYTHNMSMRIVPVSGPSVMVQSATAGTAGMLSTGNTTVSATLLNVGTVNQTGQNVELEYSTDGGATWPAGQHQIFVPTALNTGQTQSFTFTAPWTVAAVGAYSLVVRLNPAIGTLSQSATKAFAPDADVTAITLTPTVPLIGNNTVAITVKNNGTFNLNGVPLSVRYTGNKGVTYTTATFTPAALSTNGATESYTFTAPWNIYVPGNQVLTASISPQTSGDPDGGDAFSASYPNIGGSSGAATGVVFDGSIAPTSTTAYPFGTANCTLQTFWTPAQLNNLAGDVLEFGLQFNAVVNGTWPDVKITMGETSLGPTTSTTPMTTTFATNFNVPARPPVVVYNGTLAIATATTAPFFWRVPMTTLFNYTALNNLLVQIETTGSGTVTATQVVNFTQAAPINCRVYALTAHATTGTTNQNALGYGASFLIGAGAQTGASLSVKSVNVVGGVASLGSNTVTATMKNSGSTVFTNQAVTLEYSTDGGATFPAPQSQSFTIPSLAVGAETPLTFTTPWSIASVVARQVIVRVNPNIGTFGQIKDAIFQPDPDIYFVSTAVPNPLIGANPVKVTVINGGGFNLNGAALNLRYTVNGGSTYVTQTFTPATLAALGSTETFTFTTPWTITTPGSYTMSASIVPQIQGDPDLTGDTFTRPFPSAGSVNATYGFDPLAQTGQTTVSDANPFAQAQCKFQTNYTPAQLNYNYGDITEFGIQFATAPGQRTWPSVRIEMGETTYTPATRTLNFDSNYNVSGAGKKTVFDGPITQNLTATDQIWRVPMTSPFFYSGTNNLLVTIYVNGATTPTAGGANVRYVSTGIGLNSWRLLITGYGDAAVGNTTGTGAVGASFVFAGVTTAANLEMRTISAGTTGIPAVGSNTVSFSVRNKSASAQTAAFSAEYSTDGGTTWSSSQSFTPSSFTALAEQTFSFTAPWVVSAFGSYNLMVKINPAVGTAASQLSMICRPDLDLTLVTSNPALPQIGNNVISVRAQNNGTFSLNGQAQSLRYSVNGGTTWTTQSFTPAALGTTGSIEVFTFTAPWVAVAGNFSVTVESNPSPATDPDTSDAKTAAFFGIGCTMAELNTGVTEINSITLAGPGQGYPLNAYWWKLRNESVYLATELTAAGLTAGSAIANLQIKVSNIPDQDIGGFRVRMQATTASAPSATAFTTTGWTQCFGPETFVRPQMTVGEWLSIPLSPAFVWDGTSNVLIDFSQDDSLYTANGGVFLRQFASARARIGYQDLNTLAFPFDTIPNQANVNYVPSLRLFYGPALLVPDIDVATPYVLISGAKNAYRGQTSTTVHLSLSNNRAFAMQLQSFNLAALDNSGVAVSGITFTLPTLPVTVAANSTAVIDATMAIAANAGGTNGMQVNVKMQNALAIDPVNPTTNTVVVGVQDASEKFSLLDGPVPAPFLITQTTLGPATASILYFQTLSAVGGSGTYTWTIPATSPQQLPASLALTGAGTSTAPAFITGTPLATDAGTRQIKFDCTDGTYAATKTLTLLIQAEPLAFTPITGGLPQAIEGTNYSFTLSGVGGSGSYTYSVATSSSQQLPAGMSLSSATGVISGIPAPLAAGTYNITFRVNDGFQTVDNPQTLVVNPGPLLWVGPPTMSGKETVAFTGHLSAAGGVAVRSYTVATSSAQQLPAGLQLNSVTGDITSAANIGTAGVYNVTFNVTDGVTILPHTVVITIIVADPFVITTPSLPVGEATVAYTAAMAATGGSEAYSWSIVSSVPPLPASITLAAATGIFSGTPGYDDHGRYALTIKATDTANRTQTVNLILGIPQKGAPKIHLTELNVGATNYIEISHRGGDAIDLSGWNIKVWVDGTSPLALTWSALPGGTLGFPGSVIQINSGGTAGGSFPIFNTGTAFNATSASNVAVALYDASGNPIDMVVTGNIVVTALVSTGTTNAGITSEQWATNLSTGSDNYSRTAAGDNNTGADWTASATGTPGAFNPALLAPVLDFAIDAYPAAKVGVAYGRTIVSVGGVPPHAYSLVNATSTPWLSISATTGDLSGTPAAGDIGTFPVTVKVTDSTTATAQSTSNLIVLGAAENAAHSFTFSSPSLSSQANTVASVDLTLGGTATAVADFEVRFTMANPELVFTGVTKGPALTAAGASVLVWKRGDTYMVAGFYAGSGTPSAMAPGKVATLNFKVVPAGTATMATPGVTAMPVSEAVASDTQDAALSASATAGSITLSSFKNQDVNHNNTVNVQDVQLCVNLILHTATPTYTGQGDVNKSGSVTVADVQSIVNCILNAAACTQ